MNKNLDAVLTSIGDEFKDRIQPDGRHYVELDIGRQGEKLGFADIKDKYGNVFAVAPLNGPVSGMKVRIDGRTFVNYAQFDSGVAVPGYAAKDAGLPHKPFTPNDSMILNA